MEKQDFFDDEYDGYYDDVKPEDANELRKSMDRQLVGKVILLISVTVVIISACIIALLLLS